MGKKIDVNEIVGKRFKNKNDEEFYVIKYLFKEKTNYCYDIEFIETKNIQMATLNQIRKGTCIDIVQRKKMKRIQTELKLKERNRLVKQPRNQVHIPSNINQINVLSIDLATRSVGIAYSCKGKIVRWKTIKADLEDFRERGYLIVNEIVNVLETSKKIKGAAIDLVVIEDVYLGLNSSILSILSEIRGMLTYNLKKLNIGLLLVPAVFWKNKFDNLPLERKEQKEFMMNKFNEFTGEIADNDDVADAYMMLKACLGG
nr:MAG TPA: HOLLIDAY JUNCTION RESOLVASE [Caudoviricetes sp.]